MPQAGAKSAPTCFCNAGTTACTSASVTTVLSLMTAILMFAMAISLIDAADPIDVVFSDVRMPGDMDGFALAQWLRKHHPEVSVLLTSGYYASRNLGGPSLQDVKLIEKPYSQAQVLRRIRALLHTDG